MADHEFGVGPHYWINLHMEIPQNFVPPPASNGADDISIHAGTEECHGACCPKGPCRYIFIHEAHMGSCEDFDHGATGDPPLCPKEVLWHLVSHLQQHGAPADTPLARFKTPRGCWTNVTPL